MLQTLEYSISAIMNNSTNIQVSKKARSVRALFKLDQFYRAQTRTQPRKLVCQEIEFFILTTFESKFFFSTTQSL